MTQYTMTVPTMTVFSDATLGNMAKEIGGVINDAEYNADALVVWESMIPALERALAAVVGEIEQRKCVIGLTEAA